LLCICIITFPITIYPQNIDLDLEPKKTIISCIKIVGNTILSQRQIRDLLVTGVDQEYDPDQLLIGLDQVLTAYRQEGYGWTQIAVDSESLANQQIILKLQVEEVKTVQLGQIEIVGNQRFTKTELLEKLELDSTLTQSGLQDGIDRLLKTYSDHGYPKVEIKLTALEFTSNPANRANRANRRLSCRLVIREGHQTEIGVLRIHGLQKTKADIVLRELPIQTGQVFDQRKIDQAVHRLRNLGYFYQIQHRLVDRGQIDFEANVVEAKTGRLSGVIGYAPTTEADLSSDRPRLTGMLEASESNLFGTGRKMKLLWKSGIASIFEVGYEEPWIFQQPISVGLSYAKISRSSPAGSSAFYTSGFNSRFPATGDRQPNPPFSDTPIDERRADLYLKTRFQHYFESRLQVSYKRIFTLNMDGFDARRQKYALVVSLSRDSRDFYLSPTRGRREHLAFEWSRGDLNLNKGWIDLELFFALWVKQVLAIGLHGAAAWGRDLTDLQTLPTERFFLGGANTVRSYEEDWFSGIRRLYANIEYRYHLRSRSQIFAFLDFGSVAQNSWRFEPIKIGYGLGVRLESQSGILRLDYGINPEGSFSSGKLHVNLGTTF